MFRIKNSIPFFVFSILFSFTFFSQIAYSSPKLLEQLLHRMEDSPRGRKLLQDAQRKGFFSKVSFSHVSHTETIFSRSYSLSNKEEFFQVEKFIQLNENLPLSEMLYDLIHELVHFNYQELKNPYDFSMNLADFIKLGIEGPGGELAAFQMECLISWELEKKRKMYKHSLCEAYRGKGDIFLLDKARRDFYALGAYYGEFFHLQKSLPLLSGRDIRFRSSLNRSPYPIFFLKEFFHLRKQACNNDRKKNKLLASYFARVQGSRTIAKESLRFHVATRKRLLYCQSLDNGH